MKNAILIERLGGMSFSDLHSICELISDTNSGGDYSRLEVIEILSNSFDIKLTDIECMKALTELHKICKRVLLENTISRVGGKHFRDFKTGQKGE